MSIDQGDEKQRPAGRRRRAGSGRVKLNEVARLAGVSTASVSRAFNEPDKVAEQIRERVFAAARQLNWIPDAAGRALASSRTHIAGAIIPTLDNEIFARQISGMQSVYAQHGFTLLLGCSNYDPDEEVRQANAMLARGIEAIAIVGEDHPEALFEALKVRHTPYVVTYSYRDECPHPCVGFDNQAAFENITRHLLSLGHRRFAAIFQPERNNDRVKARLAGVRQCLREAGIELSPENLLIGPSTMDFGGESFARLMQRSVKPSAIICGNDNLALGALLRAPKLGLSAPDDFSITGFDDLSISSRLSPKLTTMKIDNHRIGMAAARGLLEALATPSSAIRSVELKPELFIRESTGAAPAS